MLADLLSKSYDPDLEEIWGKRADGDVDETQRVSFAHQKSSISGDARQVVRRPPPSDRLFAQRNNSNLSGIRRPTFSWCGLEWGVHRLSDIGHGPPEAQPKRVAVNETAVKINDEWSWLYAAIDIDTKLILDVALFGRHALIRQLVSTENPRET